LSIRNDLLQHSFGTLDHVRIWHQFVHQANAISLCGINDVAGEDEPVWNTGQLPAHKLFNTKAG
jgi:hypothetical protein